MGRRTSISYEESYNGNSCIRGKWRYRVLVFLAVLLWLSAAVATVANYLFLNYAPFFLLAWIIWGHVIGYFVVGLVYTYLNCTSSRRFIPIWGQVLVSLSAIPLLVSFALSLAFVFPPAQEDFASFRVGAVTSDSAKVWIRSPKQTSLELLFKPSEIASFAVNDSAVLQFTTGDDFTAVASLSNLLSNQNYDFTVSENGIEVYSGSFKTAPTSAVSSGEFTFYFGSCFLEGFPYKFGERSKAPQVLFDSFPELDLFIQVGDLIYADIPILTGTSESFFNTKYRQSLTNPGFESMFKTVPSLHMFGDHEIYNDWTGDALGLFNTAIGQSWYKYLGSSNPYTSDPRSTGKYWFSYDYGAVSFFFLETHQNRNYDTKTILGETQKNELLAWLDAKSSTHSFKFIVSPEPWANIFNNFVSVETAEAWAAFPDERAEILDHIAANNITGCVFLSGDKHAAYAAKLKNGDSEFYELSVSPLSAFDTTSGGITFSQFIADDPVDDVLFSIGGRRIGAATSYFGIIKTDFASDTLLFEIWDFFQGRAPEELSLVYSLNLTAASI